VNNAANELPSRAQPSTSNGGTVVAQVLGATSSHSDNNVKDKNNNLEAATTISGSANKPSCLIGDNIWEIFKACIKTERISSRREARRVKQHMHHREDREQHMQMAAAACSALSSAMVCHK